jgi:hypothetical protein
MHIMWESDKMQQKTHGETYDALDPSLPSPNQTQGKTVSNTNRAMQTRYFNEAVSCPGSSSQILMRPNPR